MGTSSITGNAACRHADVTDRAFTMNLPYGVLDMPPSEALRRNPYVRPGVGGIRDEDEDPDDEGGWFDGACKAAKNIADYGIKVLSDVCNNLTEEPWGTISGIIFDPIPDIVESWGPGNEKVVGVDLGSDSGIFPIQYGDDWEDFIELRCEASVFFERLGSEFFLEGAFYWGECY